MARKAQRFEYFQSYETFLFLDCSRFCPSVFLYLSSVVPSIWLLEIDKNRRRKMQMMVMKEEFNLTDFNSTLSSTFNSSFNGVFGNSINGTEDLQAIQTIVGGVTTIVFK